MKKSFDINKLKFEINWVSGVTLFSALVWAITVTILNNGYRAKIDSQGVTITSQGETITTLTTTVATLQGSMEIVRSTILAFTDNPPSAIEAKIDGLRDIVKIYHPTIGGNYIPAPMVLPDSTNRMDTVLN